MAKKEVNIDAIKVIGDFDKITVKSSWKTISTIVSAIRKIIQVNFHDENNPPENVTTFLDLVFNAPNGYESYKQFRKRNINTILPKFSEKISWSFLMWFKLIYFLARKISLNLRMQKSHKATLNGEIVELEIERARVKIDYKSKEYEIKIYYTPAYEEMCVKMTRELLTFLRENGIKHSPSSDCGIKFKY